MDHTYEASTVEMDSSGFDALQEQILDRKNQKAEVTDIREKSAQENKQNIAAPSKKYVFTKGDQSLELDDDYEIEIMADKRPTKLTLRELRERAAGGIAIKNRMHTLSEQKKQVESTFKQFTAIAKTDPLAALEFISNKAKESDTEFEYSHYIEKLAEQAEKLGQMDEKDRKAWELEKKLQKAEQDLSQKERMEAVVSKKNELIDEYGIGDQELGQMVDAVLSNEDLFKGDEDEHYVMGKVEELIQETLTQRDIMSVIKEINPAHLNDNALIFSLSDQLRQNPDLDEEDVRDILRDLIGHKQRAQASAPSEKARDARTLSNKARQSAPISGLRAQNASPYELLKLQLEEKKKEIHKTPLYMR